MEKTYVGNPFLVTVANYDASFTADPAYDDYGIVYNDRLQVSSVHDEREYSGVVSMTCALRSLVPAMLP